MRDLGRLEELVERRLTSVVKGGDLEELKLFLQELSYNTLNKEFVYKQLKYVAESTVEESIFLQVILLQSEAGLSITKRKELLDTVTDKIERIKPTKGIDVEVYNTLVQGYKKIEEEQYVNKALESTVENINSMKNATKSAVGGVLTELSNASGVLAKRFNRESVKENKEDVEEKVVKADDIKDNGVEEKTGE